MMKKGNNNKKMIRKIIGICILLALIISIIPTHQSCSPGEFDQDQKPEFRSGFFQGKRSTYKVTQIHHVHGSSLAGGVVHGNFDADSTQELIFVGGSGEGRTTLLDYNETTREFEPQVLWWDPNGGLIDIQLGELNNTNPGDEILVGGFSGNLTMLFFNSTGFAQNQTIWNTTNQNNIFGMAIGDLNNLVGNEIAVVDATTEILYILTSVGENWVETKVPLDDKPRMVYIGDIDSSHSGNEVLVLCVDGTVYCATHEHATNNWSVVEMFKDDNSPLSAAIVDVDLNNNHSGNEVVIASLSWNTTVLWGSGTTWENRTIWGAGGGLEGIGYGDFDHLHDGSELCIAGYSNTAEMIYPTEDGWYNETIFFDPDPLQTELNGALVTDFYPDNPGSELLLIGFKGPVWMLIFEPPDFKLNISYSLKQVQAGELETFQISLTTTSGYNQSINLSIDGLPPQCTYELSNPVLNEKGQNTQDSTSVLTLYTSKSTPEGIYNLTLTGISSDDIEKKLLNFKLKVTPSDIQPSPDFELKVSPTQARLNLSSEEYNAEFKLEIIPSNGFDRVVEFTIPEEYLFSPELEGKFKYYITPLSILPSESSTLEISITKSLTESFNLSIPIKASSQELGLTREATIRLEVVYFEPAKDGDDASTKPEESSMHQWISIGLLAIVIIIILGFLLKRMRTITLQDQARAQERQQERQKRQQIQHKHRTRPDPRMRSKKRY